MKIQRPSTLHDDVMHQIMLEAEAMDVARTSRVSPSLLAMKVFGHYAANSIEDHITYTSLQHLTKMTAMFLRRHLPEEHAARAVDTKDIFGDLLQDRYPASRTRDQEPVYVLREHMSSNDVQFNVHRMRAVGGRLLQHADALEAWNQNRAQTAA